MKELNGRELAEYMKENQAHLVRGLQARGVQPKLVIIRDNDNPVITRYVKLKRQYGEDIGVEVEDWLREDVIEAIHGANNDPSVHGVIVQLPLRDRAMTDDVVREIAGKKDVDGLANSMQEMNNVSEDYASGDIKNEEGDGGKGLPKSKPATALEGGLRFESATATAINWLLAGYDIDLSGRKIAIVGHGRLVGAPLERMWRNSGYNVTVFRSKDSLETLPEYDVIVSATGVPHLIRSELVGTGAVVVDAGTASEGGVLVGDVDDTVRERDDLKAITPKVGGVGPLTVTALFEHVLIAANHALLLGR